MEASTQSFLLAQKTRDLTFLVNLTNNLELDRNTVNGGRDAHIVLYWSSEIHLDTIPVGDSRNTNANIGDKEILRFVLRGASLFKGVTHVFIIRST